MALAHFGVLFTVHLEYKPLKEHIIITEKEYLRIEKILPNQSLQRTQKSRAAEFCVLEVAVMDIFTVERLAWRMRNTIDALPRQELPIPMSNFPKGACGDGSLLLGAFLVDSGFSGFEYVSAERGSHENETWASHGWLAKGDLVVDITADQFPDGPAKVVVAEPSIWHSQFEVQSVEPSDFRKWTGVGTDHLHILYAKIGPLLFINKRND